jgi:hypothetical protein
MYEFWLAVGTTYASLLHMNYRFKLCTLRLNLLSTISSSFAHSTTYQITENQPILVVPPSASLVILMKIR